MATPAVDTTSTSASTASTDTTTASLTSTSSTDVSTTTTTTSSTTPSLTSASTASDATSASLIDDSDDYDPAAPDDNTNIALRKAKRKSSVTTTTTSATSTTSPSISSATAPHTLMRGLSLRGKAVQSTLSKGLSVALQYTKEKIGQASDMTQEEDSFTQHIDYARTVAAHLKSLAIVLQALIASQQTAILAHDALAATVKKVAARSTLPVLNTPKSGARGDSASGGLAAIEEMSTAFAEGGTSPAAASAVAKVDEGAEDEKTAAGNAGEDSKASAASGLSIQPSAASTTALVSTPAGTVHLVSSFYPYTRRHLSGRLIVSDSYASLLNSVQTLQAAGVKAALAAISQLEIDRLHYDACQNNLRILSTPNSGTNLPATNPPTPHPSDPSLSDDKRRLEHEQWTLKVDAAHLTYLRSKANVEERVDELRAKCSGVLERGLSVIVAIERYEVEAARGLLSDERAGRELSVRKKTNPAAVGIRRSGGQDEAEEEAAEDVTVAT